MNSECVESAFMISSMLHEMPNICSERSSNKFFKKMIENYEKNVNFNKKYFLTMESNKDIIYFAALDLEQGDWNACYNLLLQVNIWNSFTNKVDVQNRIK